jgi:hypothetical protein
MIYVPKSSDWALVSSKGSLGGQSNCRPGITLSDCAVAVAAVVCSVGWAVVTGRGERAELSKCRIRPLRRRFATGWNSPPGESLAPTLPKDCTWGTDKDWL